MGLSKLKAGVSAVAIVMSGGATAVSAQDASKDAIKLEEIVVTARRSEESIKDVPLAIGVLDGAYMEKQKIESIEEMMQLTPGATFVSFSKVQPEKSMRGMVAPTPGNSSSEQSILTVVDGMVLSKDFMKSPPLFDIDHVEILRGPQGTTFGRNASVGLIHLVTKKPTRELESGFNITAGSDKLFEIDGYVSGPLSDTLSARLAVNFDTEDGPTESISTGEGLDGDSNKAVRVSFLFEPSEKLSAYLKIEYSEDDDEGPVRRGRGCDSPYIDGPRVSGPFTGLFANHPPFATTFTDSCDVFKTEISSGTDFFADREIFTLTGEIDYEVADGIMLTSVTGYQNGSNSGLADVLGSPENIVWQKLENEGSLFSEELRLDNHATGNQLRWLVGAYYLHDQEDRFEQNQFFQDGALGFPRVPSYLATISANTTDSIAFFGEAIYEMSDKLELAVGGRWTQDKRDYLYSVEASGFRPVIAGVTGCTPATGIVCGSVDNPVGFAPTPVEHTWSDFTAKVSLQYEVNDSNSVYALWSQGFKSGGFQPDARTAAAAQVPFDPEHSDNFELGWKGEINNQARFSLTAFLMKNRGVQTVSLIPLGAGFTALIDNVGSTETKGLEADFTWYVTQNFHVGGSLAVYDSELVDAILTTGVDVNGDPVFTDLSGQRPEVAPRWTSTFYAEYDIQMDNGNVLSFRGDFYGRDEVFDDNSERATFARLRPQLTNFGARVTYQFGENGSYRLMAWGKNLNEDYDIENTGPRQPNTLFLPEGFSGKRQYGLTLSANF